MVSLPWVVCVVVALIADAFGILQFSSCGFGTSALLFALGTWALAGAFSLSGGAATTPWLVLLGFILAVAGLILGHGAGCAF